LFCVGRLYVGHTGLPACLTSTLYLPIHLDPEDGSNKSHETFAPIPLAHGAKIYKQDQN